MLLLFLFIAACYDYKTMEVPLFLWTIPVFAEGICLILEKNWYSLFLSVCFGLIFFLFFYLCARYSNFGGADVLWITAIAFCLRLDAVYAIWLSFLFALPYTLIMRERKEYPFLPFLFFGTCFFLCFH